MLFLCVTLNKIILCDRGDFLDTLKVRFLATIPMILGIIIMIGTMSKYHALVNFVLEETYEKQSSKFSSEKTTRLLLYLFFAGFFIGIVDTLSNDVEPMRFFITIIFLLGALFVYSSIDTQLNMTQRLSEKTIETMKAFTNAIDMKDAYTKGHSDQVYKISELIYDKLDCDLKCSINKSKLLDAALLHDIGKLSIKDEILNKAGKLTEKEWEIMKLHPVKGKKILEDTCYKDISDFVLYHHERIDGTGYYGLTDRQIPIESKIIAIADTYSALCTNRVYRDALTHDEAITIIRNAAGTQFDSKLVKKFLEIDEQLLIYAISDE